MKMDTGFAADIIFGNIYILILYSNKCTSFIFYMGQVKNVDIGCTSRLKMTTCNHQIIHLIMTITYTVNG